MPPPEYYIHCLGADTKSGGDEELSLSNDGAPFGVKLRISQLNRQMVAGLSVRVLDLLEIAALVYGADAVASRGGSADQRWVVDGTGALLSKCLYVSWRFGRMLIYSNPWKKR